MQRDTEIILQEHRKSRQITDSLTIITELAIQMPLSGIF